VYFAKQEDATRAREETNGMVRDIKDEEKAAY
jgi:hypothetical protein